MRLLTYALCCICLAGGAVTSLAMTQFSPVDEKPIDTVPGRPSPLTDSEPIFFADEPAPKPRVSDPLERAPVDRIPVGKKFYDPDGLFGYDVGPDFSNERILQSRGPMRLRQVRRNVVENLYEPVPPEELAAAKKLGDAIQTLKGSSDPELQKKATETIQQQLSEQFDLDFKQREKELAEVEAKVKSLREQLDKRKTAREDIISLRLKTITNAAAGLGFPGGIANDSAAVFGPRSSFVNELPILPETRPFPKPEQSTDGSADPRLPEFPVRQRKPDDASRFTPIAPTVDPM